MTSFIERIEVEGYCRIPQVYRPEQVQRALELTRSFHEQPERQLSDRVPYLNQDQAMVYNLQNKDPFFLELLFHSTTLGDILRHFLNDVWFKSIPKDEPNYILRSYLARSSNRKLPMHIDSFIPYSGPCSYIMQCSIVLDDQNERNGCTVVVPGSHLSVEYTNQEAFDIAVPIEAKAGDLVIWDSRLWHGSGENITGRSRWALIATFSRWWLKQAFDIPGNLPQEIFDGLTDSQKAVLGFCSVPYDDESCGIDMKRGYGLLPAKVEDYRR